MAFDSDGQLAADELFEPQTLYQMLAVSDMEGKRTIRRSEHGLDPVDTDVAVS